MDFIKFLSFCLIQKLTKKKASFVISISRFYYELIFLRFKIKLMLLKLTCVNNSSDAFN